MATELRIPDLGAGVEEVTINRWFYHEGDYISAGAIVLEVATDKIDTDILMPVNGALGQHNFSEGELVPIDAVLASIDTPGDERDEETDVATANPSQSTTPILEDEPSAIGKVAKISPVARNMAVEHGISLDMLNGSGPGGQITKADVQAYIENRQLNRKPGQPTRPVQLRHVASLLVRRLAAEHNINLAEIAGDRPLGELTQKDIARVITCRDTPQPMVLETAEPLSAEEQLPLLNATQPNAAPLDNDGELIPISRNRRAIAQSTTQSASTIPHVTTWWDVDMSAVLAHYRTHKPRYAESGVRLTITAYLVQAIVAGLRAVPAANATWDEAGILIKCSYHIGVAVSLPLDRFGIGGLIVPVIKHVDRLDLADTASVINELSERARTNKLTPEELQGGTFTLTNYGVSGSRFQTPIIVEPQVGILGVGAIEKRLVVVSPGRPIDHEPGDCLAIKPMLTLGFSYDHRVLDGAAADAFCAAVKGVLEGTSFTLC